MDCVFCKIVSGENPSFKIWGNKNFLAILDINPNTKGQTLLISKKHYPSYLFEIPQEHYLKMLKAAKTVVKLLDKVLKTKRTAIILEGMGVNHTHLKLYPLHGLEKEFGAGETPKRVFFKKYPGFVTSQLGNQADFEELKRLAEFIRQKSK